VPWKSRVVAKTAFTLALVLLAALPAPAGAAPAQYVETAAGLRDRLDPLWSERAGRYVTGSDRTATGVNAAVLAVDSIAARRGAGAPREAARARAIVRWLTGPSVWRGGRTPGWMAGPRGSSLLPVYQSEAVGGLVQAYVARRELALPRRGVAAIRARIRRVARSRAFRWPALNLNQINWYVELIAARAVVEQRPRLLAHGFRRYLNRFLAGVRPRGRAAGNLGPGLRFHYRPSRRPGEPINVDSAEYANIVLGVSRFYAAARAAGMPRPAPARLRLLRAWVRRAVAGYWTHAGYLNWDTGYGFARWHQTKKLMLAQQTLIGLATAPELLPSARWGAWARWMLDRGLARYEGLAGPIPSPLAFGVQVVRQTRGAAQLAAARAAMNAALAADAGLEAKPASRPPALYAYDPDIGRLAVTTPSYNTAIIAVNQGAFPYGGIDLARLFDGDQEVAATIGGRPPGAFGLVARRGDGRILLATQRARRRLNRRVTPLRLIRAPRGVGVQAGTTARQAYAGPFVDLRTAGTVRAHRLRATSRYRFTPDRIDARWTLARSASARRVVAEVGFPSWGAGATAVAELRDGRMLTLTRAPVPLRSVRSVRIVSARGSYTIVPVTAPPRARVGMRPTRPQPSAPRAGPTLTVALGSSTVAAPLTFAVRLSVAARR